MDSVSFDPLDAEKRGWTVLDQPFPSATDARVRQRLIHDLVDEIIRLRNMIGVEPYAEIEAVHDEGGGRVTLHVSGTETIPLVEIFEKVSRNLLP